MAASVAMVLAGIYIWIAGLHVRWALASSRTNSSHIDVVAHLHAVCGVLAAGVLYLAALSNVIAP